MIFKMNKLRMTLKIEDDAEEYEDWDNRNEYHD